MKKIKSYSIVSKLATCAIALSAWAVSSVNSSADDLVFDLTNIGEDPASVQVTVSQQDPGTLLFTVSQDDDSMYGDLRGILFHVNESYVDVDALDFSFVEAAENITDDPIYPDIAATTDLNSVDYNGMNNYDILVEFGTNGIGADDISSISFTIATTIIGGTLNLFSFMPVHMENFLAARVTSTFDGNDREGSSKLTCCGRVTVPEPSSTMGLLAFALGGLLLWRRKTA